jgi:murein L,D-transpeptidase YafK
VEIQVYKSRKTLEAWDLGQLQASFPCGIGKDESGGTKLERGDMRTPEGEYWVCVKNPKSSYYLSLGLDYPNPADADRALRSGKISAQDHARILEAHAQNQGSPWDTPLGGAIYIHSELEKQSWSDGCIRLRNLDMEWLYQRADRGTRVIINR